MEGAISVLLSESCQALLLLISEPRYWEGNTVLSEGIETIYDCL